MPFYDQLRFEVQMCGSPFTIDPARRNEYVVIEVDDRYSPKLRLFSISTGSTGIMKVKKGVFNKQPLEAGSTILLKAWERRPSYHYTDGKAKPDYEHPELWMLVYEIIS